MKFFNKLLILSILVLFTGAVFPESKLSTREIVMTMLDSIRRVKTQKYELKATERVNGVYLTADSRIKINEKPKKIYFINPKKGIELLWVEGQNSGEVLVHSASVPLMNFNLDPYGSIIRKDQHHTIMDLGFSRIGITIGTTIIEAPKDFDKHFKNAGSIVWNQKDCHQIIIEYPDYKYIEHIAKKGETATGIALKYNTSDFKIREKNNLSSFYGSIKEGKVISVPVPYASKAIVYIDKKTMLPINLKIYDEKGLYESYEYYNVKTNITFATDEFSKNYKEYGF